METSWRLLFSSVIIVGALVTVTGSQHVSKVGNKPENPFSFPAGNKTTRNGKNLLEWIGFGVGQDNDVYLARANRDCLNSDLYECFKYRALTSLDDFFDKEAYTLNENARVVRIPYTDRQLEFSSEPRAEDGDWDQFVKFLLRRVERFVKSTAIEVAFPSEVTANGRYSPRFIDEIATEIDIIEDKNDSIFSRTKLKKLFIPLLVILKLFKLKLLLFLPLILGLASFKKVLGFLALVIPGLIGFFKLCKPDLHHNYGSYGHSNYYQPYHGTPSHSYQYTPYSRDNPQEEQPSPPWRSQSSSSSGVTFRDQDSAASSQHDPHQLAYKGYPQYQTKK